MRVRIALCQLKVGPDKTENLVRAEQMIGRAVAEGAEIVILPEMFSCPYDQGKFGQYADEPRGAAPAMLQTAARKNRCYLVGGSFPEREDGKLFNACYVYGPDGQRLAVHRKLHLFDVELSEGVSFRESAMLTPGSAPTLVRLGKVTAGIGICYDLRFPEYARLLALGGAEILIYPGAFNHVTGPAHWELLLRTRAVDNQLFTAGVSPAPREGMEYRAYGHSLVADPWGRVLGEAADQEQTVLAELDLDELHRVRRELPLLEHRRKDLYQ
ncbi:MAG TPA: carbon-nitrogen hydrolase family protein [Bacillota bacterium]|nr:carbon-nitrogen hydrolase family protein [Bacillota bacterium]